MLAGKYSKNRNPTSIGAVGIGRNEVRVAAAAQHFHTLYSVYVQREAWNVIDP